MFFEKLQNRKNDGFTLVETIVVIAILAILAGIAVPAYSGYVEKANIAADQQLAYDVANALQLYYYNNYSNETAPKSGYVILTASGATADTVGTVAMAPVFGDEWQSDKGTALKYDGWANDGMMAIAADQPYIGAVSDSSFMQNSTVPELLGNVQTVTMAAAEMLSGVQKTPAQYIDSLHNALGEGYLEEAVAAGIMKKNGDAYEFVNYELNEGTNNLKVTDDLKNQLSNLMVVSVARKMEKMGAEGATGLMTGTSSATTTATGLAAMYATYKAAALNLGQEGQDRLAVVDAELAKANNIAEVEAALGYFLTGADGTTDDADNTFHTKVIAYGTDKDGNPTEALISDSKAFASIMGAVNDVTDKNNTNSSVTVDANTLKDSNLFTSSAVSDKLNNFVSAADALKGMTANDIQKLTTALGAAGNGNVVIYISSTSAIAANPGAAHAAS